MKPLYQKYFRLQGELADLDWQRRMHKNFFTFNIVTGLGKKYKVTQLKLRILERLIGN